MPLKNDYIYFCFNFFLIQSENSEIDHHDFGELVSGTWVLQPSKPEEWSEEWSGKAAIWELNTQSSCPKAAAKYLPF